MRCYDGAGGFHAADPDVPLGLSIVQEKYEVLPAPADSVTILDQAGPPDAYAGDLAVPCQIKDAGKLDIPVERDALAVNSTVELHTRSTLEEQAQVGHVAVPGLVRLGFPNSSGPWCRARDPSRHLRPLHPRGAGRPMPARNCAATS